MAARPFRNAYDSRTRFRYADEVCRQGMPTGYADRVCRQPFQQTLPRGMPTTCPSRSPNRPPNRCPNRWYSMARYRAKSVTLALPLSLNFSLLFALRLACTSQAGREHIQRTLAQKPKVALTDTKGMPTCREKVCRHHVTYFPQGCLPDISSSQPL